MIRRGLSPAEGHSETVAEPAGEAHRRVQEFAETSEYGDRINYDTCSFLLKLAQDGTVREAITQLHLQVAVLIWSAFEVASRELFRARLNRHPTAYTNLLQDSELRKRFELTRVSLDRVADFNFDLSSRVGDLLLEHNDLADLPTIRASFSALFPADSAVRESLAEQELWRLFQRRHLIVHRQGIVDLRYRELTGDEQPMGVRLLLQPCDLDKYLELTTTATRHILSAVTKSRGTITS